MKIRHSTSGAPDKVEQQMTPMIDIVFQLLTFFIMSFKIATVEGDFSIKMPLAAPSQGKPDPENLLPPIQVRLTAGPDGQLTGIRMGQRALPSFAALHQEIIGIVGTESGPGTLADQSEVELDCDYDLRYENVISAITAISGYVTPDRRIVKLIEKIKFAPPRKGDAAGGL
jgi:biopolymer transport protein ExbD